MRPTAFTALILLSLITASTAAAPLVRRITEVADLGTFGGVQTEPTAINNRGEIVGFVRNATGNSYDAFLWTPRHGYERIVDNPEGSSASGINERGEVVGAQTKCIVEPNSTACFGQGFIWSRRNGLRDLNSFIPLAINNRGEMAGSCIDTEQQRACVMRAGVTRRLDSPPAPTALAVSINARGDIVGYSEADLDFGPWRALFWPREGGVIDLGDGRTSDINNRGTIVGRHIVVTDDEEGLEFHSSARVWTTSGVVERPAGQIASAINERGWVLVNVWGRNAYVWDPRSNARVILESSFGEATIGIDMNDRGDVVGLADTGIRDGIGIPVYHVVIWRVRGRDMKTAGSQ